ncbi:MAG: aminopeptidase [Planctomycetota bacterium]|jgi:leucyl aminopeptidase (aminopeptidase T)
MKKSFKILGPGLGAVLLGVAAGLAGPQPALDTAKIADTLVNTSSNIRYGELVLINGGTRDQQLLEDIAVEVRKLGAHPLISIESDRLTRKMVEEVDQRYDAQEPALALRMAEIVDAIITVDHSEQPDLLADVPAARLSRQAEAFRPVYGKILERGVLYVHLGNGLYPTKALARQFEISESELSKIFWNAVMVDYDRLQAVGGRVKNILAAGREVRITAPNGTDLTVDVTKRPVFVSDGVISSEDRYAGGPACQVWLPAGEVYVTPVPGTADGTFVADTYFFEGELIEGLKLEFEDGKLSSMTAKSDISALKERFEAAPAGREVFSALDIGVNANLQIPARSRMVTWMGAGTISLGIGGNTWAGGSNEVPYNLFGHLVNGTLTVDGRKLIDQGKLIEQ